jgi:opacity protein-like surface antigen
MKRSILASFCIVLSAAVVSARAQVAPAAYRSSFTLSAGALGSRFQPDYEDSGVAHSSPYNLYGIGAYVDADFSRWVKIEAEGRWLRFNQFLGVDENTYMIGPRVAPYTFHKITPYGKVLFGWGSGSFLAGRSFALAYGGGADYRLTRRFAVRGDFEYQQWQVTSITLHPYGVSAGISYRILPWR